MASKALQFDKKYSPKKLQVKHIIYASKVLTLEQIILNPFIKIYYHHSIADISRIN